MPHNRVHLREVRADGVAYWQAYWSIGNGKKRARSLGRVSDKSRADALKECEALERDHIVNPPATGPDMTCKEWGTRYLGLKTDIGASTRTLYEESIAHLDAFFGKCPVAKITPTRATEWRNWMIAPESAKPAGRGLAEATARKHCRHAKTMFGSTEGAILHGVISKNPFAHLASSVQESHHTDPDLEHEHIERLVSAATTHAWKCAVALCGWAGLRRGEMKRLEWRDILWEKNRIIVRAKAAVATTKSRHREVLLEPQLAAILLAAHDAAEPGATHVAPIPNNNNEREFRTIIRHAGMAPWPDPFHTLRRFRANSWRNEGHPENHIDYWMGHSLATARRHYTAVPEAAYSPEQQKSINLRKLFLSLDQPGKDRLIRFAETLVSRQASRSYIKRMKIDIASPD